jgi:HK97 family phage major capsid protein
MATASQQYRNKALREERGQIKAALEALGTKLRNENRAMSAEEKGQFDKLKASFSTVSESIRASEADMAALDQLVNAEYPEPEGDAAPADAPPAEGMNSKRVPGREDRNGGPRGINPEQRAEDVRLARQAWARSQSKIPLTREHKAACERLGFNPKRKELDIRLGNPRDRKQRWQQRALTVTTSGGGYLIAEDYSYELEVALVDFSGVRGICREVQTEDGSDLPWPTETDTGNTGELLAINTATATNADPTFSSVTFGAYKYSSKAILVPNELIQDAAFDVDSLIFEMCGTRIGRAQGAAFTTGTGTNQPKGVVTCASAGLTTAAAAAFTADELTRLAHTVDPAYRKGASVGYMMKDDVLAYCLLLKDANGNPLLRERFNQGGGTDGNRSSLVINGFPVFVNQNMTGLTSNVPVTATKHVLFGDFSKFIVRDAGSVRMKRLEERYAIEDQVAFVGFLRSDSNCVNTAAIKYMLQA